MELAGREVQTVQVAPSELAATLFERSFETVLGEMERLDRMFIEPDGSFVWTSAQNDRAWQVDGNLYDRAQRLAFVDINGSCPRYEFELLMTALGWPETPLVFQLTREAIVLGEDEFRRYAAN